VSFGAPWWALEESIVMRTVLVADEVLDSNGRRWEVRTTWPRMEELVSIMFIEWLLGELDL
jgi:hypothetical protein